MSADNFVHDGINDFFDAGDDDRRFCQLILRLAIRLW